jgi:hypothetical protein
MSDHKKVDVQEKIIESKDNKVTEKVTTTKDGVTTTTTNVVTQVISEGQP